MQKKEIYYSSSDDFSMDDESGPNFGESFGGDLSGEGETEEKKDGDRDTSQNLQNNGGYGYKDEEGSFSGK